MSRAFFLKCLVLPGLVLLSGLLICQPARSAETWPGQAGQPLEQRYRGDIKKLHLGIQSHLDKLQKSGKREFSLLGELEHINTKLNLQKIKLNVMEENLRTQAQQLAEKDQDLARAAKEKEKARLHLEKRLRAFYLVGETGFLNVAFSAKKLPELLLFNNAFRRMLEYDHEIIIRYRKAIVQLQRAREAQALEKTVLENFIVRTVQERKTLADLRGAKKQLLALVRTRKGLYEQALREMQKAEANLTRSLTRLKIRQKNKAKGFILNKGRMLPPVTGRLVVRFGAAQGEKSDKGNTAQGITIATEDGAPVRAIFSGKVIFTGYKLGYGNMVIIDHGLQYVSVTARMEKITVKDGQSVEQGEVIGTTGDIATLFAKGLYFEIRHNLKPLNPLKWFSKKGISEIETGAPPGKVGKNAMQLL
ncbi:murein hydrolase activator NlpD precursor [bacterium BMS3Bbin14]|nr:murein hydrolase activator NlpD precursor [bacterium BMS3Abin13]GBE51861.1 murein hydrolase activator NlpD precursor [bacterium BMS3Bbin14]HDK43059.1 hypothetical protein [Desulfobacteraceae bacterium]HDL98782.1 hypothetical protein [Desulfobacteraceae bacterium]HDO30653.1 hypothetical protein [Desulfobacteraceae bacterium]